MNNSPSQSRPLTTTTRRLVMLAAMTLLLPFSKLAYADPLPPLSDARKKQKLKRHDNKNIYHKTHGRAVKANAAKHREPVSVAPSTMVRTAASTLIAQATDLLGVSYRYGGKTPMTGLDCSGLVIHVFKETLGIALPHNASQMSQVGQRISQQALRPGDLVFFNTMKRAFSHVGIYVGDNKFIHSPKPGGVVEIVDMNIRYWRQRYQGARRIAELEHHTESSL